MPTSLPDATRRLATEEARDFALVCEVTEDGLTEFENHLGMWSDTCKFMQLSVFSMYAAP